MKARGGASCSSTNESVRHPAPSEVVALGFHKQKDAQRAECALRVMYHEKTRDFDIHMEINEVTQRIENVTQGMMDDENAMRVARALDGFSTEIERNGYSTASLHYRKHWPALMRGFIDLRSKSRQVALDSAAEAANNSQNAVATPPSSPLSLAGGTFSGQSCLDSLPSLWPQATESNAMYLDSDYPSDGHYPSMLGSDHSAECTTCEDSVKQMESAAEVVDNRMSEQEAFLKMDTFFQDLPELNPSECMIGTVPPTGNLESLLFI